MATGKWWLELRRAALGNWITEGGHRERQRDRKGSCKRWRGSYCMDKEQSTESLLLVSLCSLLCRSRLWRLWGGDVCGNFQCVWGVVARRRAGKRVRKPPGNEQKMFLLRNCLVTTMERITNWWEKAGCTGLSRGMRYGQETSNHGWKNPRHSNGPQPYILPGNSILPYTVNKSHKFQW